MELLSEDTRERWKRHLDWIYYHLSSNVFRFGAVSLIIAIIVVVTDLLKMGLSVPRRLNSVAFLAALLAAFIAADQIQLTRRFLYGRLYFQAKVTKLQFILPPSTKQSIVGFGDLQKEDEEVSLGKEVTLDSAKDYELPIMFYISKPQTIRTISVGFHDEDSADHAGHLSQPEILDQMMAPNIKIMEKIPRGASINWHGNLKIEYPFSRRIMPDWMVFSILLRPRETGSFKLFVRVATEEAKHTFKDTLTVHVSPSRD